MIAYSIPHLIALTKPSCLGVLHQQRNGIMLGSQMPLLWLSACWDTLLPSAQRWTWQGLHTKIPYSTLPEDWRASGAAHLQSSFSCAMGPLMHSSLHTGRVREASAITPLFRSSLRAIGTKQLGKRREIRLFISDASFEWYNLETPSQKICAIGRPYQKV